MSVLELLAVRQYRIYEQSKKAVSPDLDFSATPNLVMGLITKDWIYVVTFKSIEQKILDNSISQVIFFERPVETMW